MQNEAVSNCWLTSALIEGSSSVTPADVISVLAENNIEARHLWNPMHCQPVFKSARFVSLTEESVSPDLFRRGVCLPSDTKMTDADIDRVCGIVKTLF
jgi:pyridoxal phosphate-dependent aminotransferase EpsN